MLGLLGKKKGMTQIFVDGGERIPVTVVELGPCTVTQCKTGKSDGYNAVQLGFGVTTPKKLTKAQRGHLEKNSLPLYTHLREFRTDRAADYSVGEELLVTGFKAGDIVHVTGVTKGRGFQGVMKRHGKHGGPASHGSNFHRRPGSIGMRTWPSRVFKNTRLPGHMGCDNVTIRNLEVVAIRPEDNILLVRGGIPGAREGLVVVTPVDVEFEARPELKRIAENKAADEQVESKKVDETQNVEEDAATAEAPAKTTDKE